MLQDLVSVGFLLAPVQECPLFAISRQVTLRLCSPPPQLTEQVDHKDTCHLPSKKAGKVIEERKKNIASCIILGQNVETSSKVFNLDDI